MSLVPLADVKAHLNITVDVDTELQEMIDAAETAISRKLGGTGTLAAEEVTQQVHGYGREALVLTSLPITSITSITDSTGAVLDLSTLYIDTTRGIVRWNAYSTVPFLLPYYTAVYQSGYANLAALPSDYVLAVKELTRHLWATQRGTGITRPGAGPSDNEPSAAYTFPKRVLELIASTTPPGFA